MLTSHWQASQEHDPKVHTNFSEIILFHKLFEGRSDRRPLLILILLLLTSFIVWVYLGGRGKLTVAHFGKFDQIHDTAAYLDRTHSLYPFPHNEGTSE